MSFLEDDFQLVGKFNPIIYFKTKFLPIGGESVNIFELTSRLKPNDYYIAKQYTFGLSQQCLDIYQKLQKNMYTEHLVDYSIVKADCDIYYFGIFDKINYGHEYIRLFFNEDESVNLIKDALEYIHSKDIIHLDIKPNNIMCSRENIKLIDFEFSTNLKAKINPIGYSLIEYTHIRRLFDKTFLNFSVDYWAALCSIYEIFYGEILLDFNENDFNIIFKSIDDVIDKMKKDTYLCKQKKHFINLLFMYLN